MTVHVKYNVQRYMRKKVGN